MFRTILLGIALATVAASPALAADQTKKAARQELRDNRITGEEAKLLRAYYKFERKAEKAAGENNRPNLPAGWKKQLDKGWTLDPQILAASEPVPADVVKKLGSQPANSSLIRIQNRVIRIDAAKKIQDVIDLTPN
ncbi:MAG: hypothetical protein K0Q68_2279 [Moraxellaceae bacterium]|jgi:hypothetical protein|nr:hypothetical protein [Moraxellaceae bacterium]